MFSTRRIGALAVGYTLSVVTTGSLGMLSLFISRKLMGLPIDGDQIVVCGVIIGITNFNAFLGVMACVGGLVSSISLSFDKVISIALEAIQTTKLQEKQRKEQKEEEEDCVEGQEEKGE